MHIYVEFDGLRLYSSNLVHLQSPGLLWCSVPFEGGSLFLAALSCVYAVLQLAGMLLAT